MGFTLPIGTVLGGDYKIVRKLGEGGMGAVWLAEQLSTGSQRALKTMQAGLLDDAEMRRRFEQEARVGAKIKSDHVVQVIAAGVDAATALPYLAMELLEGHTLADAIEKGPLPPHEVREVMGQLLHAMAAAHAEGVVHRDLKPENVYLAYSRREGARYTVKVLDFGIAKVVAEAKPSATRAIGTPLWMAPEQSKHGEQVGPATDVWALGLIAFRMLTGRYFWKGAYEPNAETWTVMREVLVDALPSASARAQEYGVAQLLPAGFDVWFGRAVARDAAWRFPNAAEARAALLPILDAAVARAPAPSYAGAASYAAPTVQNTPPAAPQTPPWAPPPAPAPYATPHPAQATPARAPANATPHPAQTPPRTPAYGPAPQYGPSGAGVAPRPFKKPSTLTPWLIGCGTIVVLGGLGIAAFFGLGLYLAGNQSACQGGDLDSCETACFGMGTDGPSCARIGDTHAKDWSSPTRVPDAVRAYEHGCTLGHAPSCRHAVALDGAKGIAALDAACSGEHDEVCGLLAEALADGPRVVHDEARAASVAKTACDKGNAEGCAALARLALRAEGGADPKRAADLAQQACHLDAPEACFEIAIAKRAGYGAPTDADDAKALFLKAEHLWDARCSEGEGDACLALGKMYGLGVGVSSDTGRAMNALTRGCDAGEAHACWQAGEIALLLGPTHDVAKGKDLLDRACKAGLAIACVRDARECDADKPLVGCSGKWDSARKAATEGCNAGVAEDCTALAAVASEKRAPGVDPVATAEKACDLGHGAACSRAVEDGKEKLGPVRTKKALARGCSLGDADSCAQLADLLDQTKDPAAAELRSVACARGDEAACER